MSTLGANYKRQYTIYLQVMYIISKVLNTKAKDTIIRKSTDLRKGFLVEVKMLYYLHNFGLFYEDFK